MSEVKQDCEFGRRGVNLKKCIEELVSFTLTAHINGALDEFDLGLSKDYCSKLLQNDPALDTDSATTSDSFVGIPQYPLYRRLSSALYELITRKSLSNIYSRDLFNWEENTLKQRVDEGHRLVLEKGSELLTILSSIQNELHVQEPFFSYLKDGLKTIEGRCATGKYNLLGSGTLLLINKCTILKVQDIIHYTSFSEMLTAENLSKVLPGVQAIEEGVEIYRKFYTDEQERSNGVLAIHVSRETSQPYACLATILTELSYGGIQTLLGATPTVGTVLEALPPPRSVLLSSIMLPCSPDTKGSSLTHGARAVAKHVDRSNDKYWGYLYGNDLNKNKLAVDIINNLLDHCCWLNIHIVPTHGAVFEIRVAEGYGARWSVNGTEFIGLLEPYAEDGCSKRWKH